MRGKHSEPFDGWLTKYKVDRLLSDYEVQARLDPKVSVSLPPIDNRMLKVNSVFLEYMDRHFFFRGYAALGGVIITVFNMWAGVMLLIASGEPMHDGVLPTTMEALFMQMFSLPFFALFLWIFKGAVLRDFFCYTHYPIRFNRVNRKVYVFQRNSSGGVFSLGWDEFYWFVGRSKFGYGFIYDLRCHYLDSDGVIRFTCAVGNFFDTRAQVLQHWEMIRRYMEESPGDLPFPPLALVVSAEPTLRNCITIQVGGLSTYSPKFLLITVPWAFFRWISQMTCRRPRWPDEVEAQCQISIDDPYRLPEPASSGEVVGLDEVAVAALFEYREKAEAAALAYEAAASVQIPSH